LEIEDDSSYCSECGSDLTGVLALIGVTAEDASSASPSMNVDISDTAISGDVNIVQRLQADSDDIVDKLVEQLDRFDINKPGLSVPEGGFSRLDVEAAIPLVRENMDILRGMESVPLLQFGKLLDSMGWPEIAKRVGKLLLERDEVAAEPLWKARSHLIMARSCGEMFDPAAAIAHAEEAIEISGDAGLGDIEAYALYLSIDKRKDLARNTSKQAARVEALLEAGGIDSGPAGAWCHLALSRHLDTVNPMVAEHHEAMGFQQASNHSDLEAMVATILATAENSIWTIKERFWDKSKLECEMNGLASYSMLIDLANFVRSGSEQQLLAGIRTLTRHAKGRGMREMHTLAGLLATITEISDMVAVTDYGSARNDKLAEIMGGEEIGELMDEILLRSYQGLDDALLYRFIVLSLTGTQLPRSAQGYLDMARQYPNDSVKAMIMLYQGLNQTGRQAQSVIEEVAQFLSQSKLRGSDTAWLLVEEIASFLSVRFSDVDRHRRDDAIGDNAESPENSIWSSVDNQILSSRLPKVSIVFSFIVVVFAEAILGFFHSNTAEMAMMRGAEYHCAWTLPNHYGNSNYDTTSMCGNWRGDSFANFLDIFSFTLIASIVILTVLLLIAGSPRRRRIPKSEALPGRKQLSLFPAFLMTMIAHGIIFLIFYGDHNYSGDHNFRSNIDSLFSWAGVLIFICVMLYLANNSSNRKDQNGCLAPRSDFILMSFMYWFFMLVILALMFDEIVSNDRQFYDCHSHILSSESYVCYDDGFGTDGFVTRSAEYQIMQADYWRMFNLLIITSLCIPILYAGFSKHSRKITGFSMIGIAAAILISILLVLGNYSMRYLSLVVTPLAIILSYLVWMSPWEDEKPIEWEVS
jgi:hypothetical protein